MWTAMAALAASLLLAGCASLRGEEEQHSEQWSVVDFADRRVSFHQPPERIVALGYGEVNIVYALGASVVGRPAVDDLLLNDETKSVQEVGSTHSVDLEKIAMAKPDVVLGNYPLNLNDVPLLEGIGAKVVLTHANSVADIRKQIALIGNMLGKGERASELIAAIDDSLNAMEQADEIRKSALLVYGAPGTYLAALPNSLAGNIVELAGGTNVASRFPSLQNFPQYAQLNTERVVEANPDYIFIMTHGNGEEVQKGFVGEMESNPAWNTLTAVQEGRIQVLPPDLFGTNPGTRVVEAVQLMRELMTP